MLKNAGSLISSAKYWGGVVSGVGLCVLLMQMFPDMPVKSAALGVVVVCVGVMLANLPQDEQVETAEGESAATDETDEDS